MKPFIRILTMICALVLGITMLPVLTYADTTTPDETTTTTETTPSFEEFLAMSEEELQKYEEDTNTSKNISSLYGINNYLKPANSGKFYVDVLPENFTNVTDPTNIEDPTSEEKAAVIAALNLPEELFTVTFDQVIHACYTEEEGMRDYWQFRFEVNTDAIDPEISVAKYYYVAEIYMSLQSSVREFYVSLLTYGWRVWGDVNLDGAVTIADVVFLQKCLLGRDVISSVVAGDLNYDNKVNVFDLCVLKMHILENNKF